MKKLSGVALAFLVGMGPAFAACPSGQVLRKVGTVFASDTEGAKQIVDGPIAINAWSSACTGSACTVTFYDGDEVVGEADANDVVAERGGVASGGGFEEFDTPLYFRDGVSAQGDNVAGVMVYVCSPTG